MKIRKLVFLPFCLLMFVGVALGNVQWKPISPAELQMTEPVVEKDADAEAIFWEVRLDDKNRKKLFFEHYVRVKIFTERGKEKFSKVDIRYYKGKKIENIAARVIKPDGTITPLSQSEIFDREIVRANKFRVRAKSFAVPGIEPGVIVEYQYRERFKGDSLNGERLMFQRDIPMQRVSYAVRPYKNMTLSPRFFNMQELDFVRDHSEDGFFVVTKTNVPAYKEEPYMAPEDAVKPWALLSYSSYRNSWSSMGRSLTFAVESITKKDKAIQRKTLEVTRGAATAEKKVKAIFDFVRSDIRNLSYRRSGSAAPVKRPKIKKASDVLKYKTGTVQDIEALFIAMCRSVNIPAWLVYASDRSEFFLDPNKHPFMPYYMNYGFVAVRINGKKVYLNPGVPFLPYGRLYWTEENIFALSANSASYRWEAIPLTGHEESRIKRVGKFELSESGEIQGSVQEELTGHVATDVRSADYRKSDEEKVKTYQERLEESYDTAEYTNVRLSNFYEPEKPVILNYDVKIPDYAIKTGSRMFFIPAIFEAKSKPIFSSNDRKYPIYFRYPKSELDEIEVKLPESYQLDGMNPPANVSERKKLAGSRYTVDYDKETHTLKYTRNHFIGGGSQIYFNANAYPALKRLFDLFHKSDTHSLALKRVEQ